jgi:hypothetical protein
VTWSLLIPALAALAACLSIGTAQRRLPPRAATWLLTLLIAGTGLAVLWATSTVALGFVAQHHPPWLGLGWCRHLYRHGHHVPPALGVTALVALAVMGAGSWRARRRYRRYASLPGNAVEIIPSAIPMAMTLPGRTGPIVVSTGMLRSLDSDETRVVFAHERAHLHHRHYRFLAVAELTASALPVLRPVLHEIRHATERWADESAAAEVGDRRLVAQAIARAALATTGRTSAPAMAMATSGVPARVEALLRPLPSKGAKGMSWVALGVAALVVATAGSMVQLHHLVAFALHVC